MFSASSDLIFTFGFESDEEDEGKCSEDSFDSGDYGGQSSLFLETIPSINFPDLMYTAGMVSSLPKDQIDKDRISSQVNPFMWLGNHRFDTEQKIDQFTNSSVCGIVNQIANSSWPRRKRSREHSKDHPDATSSQRSSNPLTDFKD